MKSFNKTIEWKESSTNKETGEQVETFKSVSVKVNTNTFYFTYIESISWIIGVTNAKELQVLSIICLHAEYNKGVCLLPPDRRKEFCEKLEMNSNTFGVCLSRLVKRGLLRNSGGVVEINPICFWKGTNDERDKLLKEQGLELRIKFKSEDAS